MDPNRDTLTDGLNPDLVRFIYSATKSTRIQKLVFNSLKRAKLDSSNALRGLGRLTSEKFLKIWGEGWTDEEVNTAKPAELYGAAQVCDRARKFALSAVIVSQKSRGAPSIPEIVTGFRGQGSLSAIGIADNRVGEAMRERARAARAGNNIEGEGMFLGDQLADSQVELGDSQGAYKGVETREDVAPRGRDKERANRPKLMSLKDPQIDPFAVAIRLQGFSETLKACIGAGYTTEKLRNFALRAFTNRCSKRETLLKYTRFMVGYLTYAENRSPPAPICGEWATPVIVEWLDSLLERGETVPHGGKRAYRLWGGVRG